MPTESVESLPPNFAENPSRWVNHVTGLVSPPDICLKIFDMVESGTASAQDIGEVINKDPNLTARLLKIVNSAYFHFTRRIDTVSRAVAVIGVSELYNLVIAVSAIKSFSKIPNCIVNIDSFWRHSIFCAIVARMLAKRCHILHPERLFVAGLLHDIGSLVLYNRAPEVAKVLLISAKGDEDLLYKLEMREFGFSHADLGALLLDSWQVPEELKTAVKYHHQPYNCPDANIEAAIVHIAEALANYSELGSFSEIPPTELYIDAAAWEILGLRPSELETEEIIGEAGLQFLDSVTVLAT